MIERAKKYGLYCLNIKNLTEQELYDKLVKKGYEDVAAEVLADFVKAGLLNDRDYAYMYISDGINIKCKGLYRLGQELIRKGVSKSVINEVSQGFTEDCYNSLAEFVRVRYGDCEIEDRKALEKIKAQLLRRGYSYGEIRRCFDEFDWSDIY